MSYFEMSAFDFCRFRNLPGDEISPSRVTTRDLQKARRSAARSIIRKPKIVKNDHLTMRSKDLRERDEKAQTIEIDQV